MAADAETGKPAPQAPAAPAKTVMAPVASSAPVVEEKPAFRPVVSKQPEPQVSRAEEPAEEMLPVVADLDDIATTLAPASAGGGALPSEIPDFFLKMPTGRSMPTSRPVMPIAPVAPRSVVPSRPAPVQAAVRIVDSRTADESDAELVTMTSIPDDWPS